MNNYAWTVSWNSECGMGLGGGGRSDLSVTAKERNPFSQMGHFRGLAGSANKVACWQLYPRPYRIKLNEFLILEDGIAVVQSNWIKDPTCCIFQVLRNTKSINKTGSLEVTTLSSLTAAPKCAQVHWRQPAPVFAAARSWCRAFCSFSGLFYIVRLRLLSFSWYTGKWAYHSHYYFIFWCFSGRYFMVFKTLAALEHYDSLQARLA